MRIIDIENYSVVAGIEKYSLKVVDIVQLKKFSYRVEVSKLKGVNS